MNLQEFKNLKIGDVVFAVINTGVTGIGKFQYASVTTCHAKGETFHVFLSEYLVSTILVQVGREDKSRRLKNLFLLESDAIARKALLKEDETDLY